MEKAEAGNVRHELDISPVDSESQTESISSNIEERNNGDAVNSRFQVQPPTSKGLHTNPSKGKGPAKKAPAAH